MESAFVLTENLDRLPLEVRRMIWGHLADMIEDHHGYRSINRGALPLSLGKFVVYTSELLLRHDVVFTLGSNPSDLWRYKRILACVDKWRSILAICGFHHSGYIGVSRPYPYYCETRRLKKFQLHSTFLALHKLAASPGPGQVSLNLTFAHLFDDFFGGIEVSYVLGNSELSRINVGVAVRQEVRISIHICVCNIVVKGMTSLLDRIEDLPPELRRMIWKVSIDNIERQELEARNSLSTYIHSWIFKLKDRWILQEQPSSILHHLKQCVASRHPWIESSYGTEYLEELIAT
ncbi:hypothetical protein D6C84_06015 [Aureobasidium pullulans]|uniref:Uncharacterized protein n=1 Tax=Aureobasidium pullulans TaxID=5580 RepID=A0A4S9XV10_AURPU|nr:hypothetical protein D6C84_06015 [Aureobasidium pullulans]